MAEDKRFIKKIELSDGSVRYIYDMDAARSSDLDNYLLKSGGTITGDLTIDQLLTANSLKVVSVSEIQTAAGNVLTQSANGTIVKRSTNDLLSDIGGCSYSLDADNGVLKFQIGKQNS